MSLQGASLVVGSASYSAPSGGTTKSFANTGKVMNNAVEVACFADALTTRDVITSSVKPPVLQADGSYTMARASHKARLPRAVTINGVSTMKIETVEVVYSYYPDADTARRANLRNYAAAFALDSDVSNVMDTMSLA